MIFMRCTDLFLYLLVLGGGIVAYHELIVLIIKQCRRYSHACNNDKDFAVLQWLLIHVWFACLSLL